MSTTEQPAPPIGSPEWARSLPPSVFIRGDVAYQGTHVWTDDKGNIKGRIELGGADFTFRAPAQVRDLIARLAALAGEMDAEIARQQPAETETGRDRPVETLACSECGATGLPWIDGRCICRDRCAERVAARDAEAAKASDLWQCEDCGWAWPLKDVPYQDAECDACGGTMVKAEAAKAGAR